MHLSIANYFILTTDLIIQDVVEESEFLNLEINPVDVRGIF